MEQAALPVRAARVTPAGPGRGPLASAPEPRLRNAPNWQFCAVDHDNLAILKGVPNQRSALSRAVAAPPGIHCPSQSPVLNGPAADVTGEVSDPGLRRHIRAGRPVGRGAAWRPQAGRGAHGRFEITSGQAARIAFMQPTARCPVPSDPSHGQAADLRWLSLGGRALWGVGARLPAEVSHFAVAVGGR